MTDISPMQLALQHARRATELDEVPVGAVIVDSQTQKVIAAAHNLTESQTNPTAHAEMLVIQEACKKLSTTRLLHCDLYVTLEPCPMCAHAISLVRFRRLYFGAYDSKGGGVEHGPRIFQQSSCHHKPEVIGGVDERACGEVLKQFFAQKRVS